MRAFLPKHMLRAGHSSGGFWDRHQHSLSLGDKIDFDHLVFGPAKVFTLNAHHHPDKRVWAAEHAFMVSGHHRAYLPKAASEARRAARA